MSSRTTVTMNRRTTKERRRAHKRKMKTGRKSTLSYAELFQELGPPSEPKPARQS